MRKIPKRLMPHNFSIVTREREKDGWVDVATKEGKCYYEAKNKYVKSINGYEISSTTLIIFDDETSQDVIGEKVLIDSLEYVIVECNNFYELKNYHHTEVRCK